MKILLATDGSAAAAVGVQLAAAVAWPAASTLRVVTAVDTGSALFGGPWPAAALVQASDVEAELQEYANRIVREAAGLLRRPELAIETAVLKGRPAVAVCAEADRFDADLIIVGGRGHGRIESMLHQGLKARRHVFW